MPIQFPKTQKAIIEKYGGICSDEYAQWGGKHLKLFHPVNGKCLMVKHGLPNGSRGETNFTQCVKWWCDADHPYGMTGEQKAKLKSGASDELDHEEPQAEGGNNKEKKKLTKQEKKMMRLAKFGRK